MCNYFWRVGCRKDGGGEADNAVHCQCVWGQRFLDSADQGHGAGHKSSARVLWKCEDTAKQQLVAIRQVSGVRVQCQGEPVGANITNYLLEKSRVVGQITNERNFHIFYQFTKGAPQKYRDNFGVQQPQSYLYTSRSKCYDVPGIDDLAEFKDTLNAMKIIG